MIVRTVITISIIILGIIFTLGIIVPTLKDSITNFDVNKEKSFTKIIWSIAQLLAIVYIIYKRITRPSLTKN